MPLRPCYRATCDCPRCKSAEMVPHQRSAAARSQLRAMGWTFVRWRVGRPGVKEFKNAGRTRVRDTGGSGRMLVLCPTHRGWRPVTGVELPLRGERA